MNQSISAESPVKYQFLGGRYSPITEERYRHIMMDLLEVKWELDETMWKLWETYETDQRADLQNAILKMTDKMKNLQGSVEQFGLNYHQDSDKPRPASNQ